MRAAVRSVTSSDVDLTTFRSASPHEEAVWVCLLVGPSDGPGEESFDVLVCSPAWLAREAADRGPQVGRHRLVVEPFNLMEAAAYLRTAFESVEAEDWTSLGEKLSRLGKWEFEDYRP